MKPRFLSRIAFFIIFYAALFFALVSAQFMRQAQFTRQVGNFNVSGVSRESSEGEPKPRLDEYYIEGIAKSSYGGLDFILSNGDKQLAIIDIDGNKMPLSTVSLKVTGDRAHFILTDGAELIFYTQKAPERDGLIISGILPEKAEALWLPIAAAPQSRAGEDEGRWTVFSANTKYRFDRDLIADYGRYLVLPRENPMVFYGAAQRTGAFNHADYIVRGAMEKSVYDEAQKHWLDEVFAFWEKAVPETLDEALVTAFLAEAAQRGSYMSALQLVPESFRLSDNATYLSSPYLGRLTNALNTLSKDIRAEPVRFSAQIRETPRILLSGTQAFKFWTLVENKNLIEERGLYARSVEPATVTFDEIAGILEGWNEWAAFSPNSENPFNRLMPRALELLSAALKLDKIGGGVYAFDGLRAEMLYNFRMALALEAYGQTAQNSGWAGIGRSIAISVLSLTQDAALPAFLYIDEDGNIAASENENGAPEILQAASLYTILTPSQFYPRAADLSGIQNGLWAWTAARSVNAVFQNNVMDITLNFPVGWSHHLLIRGLSPFQKIQLRDVDFRSDPRFEQYNSHGWAYSAQENTLLVKIVQRVENEHIRIFY